MIPQGDAVALSSSLYVGRLAHSRFLPKQHSFSYKVMMFHLYLDELDSLTHVLPQLRLRGEIATAVPSHSSSLGDLLPGRYVVRRSDFLPTYPGSLQSAALALHSELIGGDVPVRVSMLANLRSLGWGFNPITVYYFHDSSGDVVNAVAEVTNTPWGERHVYPIGPPGTCEFPKAHHVSPFLEMEGTYRLRYGPPTERLHLTMGLHDPAVGGDLGGLGPLRFAAALSMEARPLDVEGVRWISRRYPGMSLRVTERIYMQAGRLFLRGVKFVPHPRSSSSRRSA